MKAEGLAIWTYLMLINIPAKNQMRNKINTNLTKKDYVNYRIFTYLNNFLSLSEAMTTLMEHVQSERRTTLGLFFERTRAHTPPPLPTPYHITLPVSCTQALGARSGGWPSSVFALSWTVPRRSRGSWKRKKNVANIQPSESNRLGEKGFIIRP